MDLQDCAREENMVVLVLYHHLITMETNITREMIHS